jgi:hypothetical protein
MRFDLLVNKSTPRKSSVSFHFRTCGEINNCSLVKLANCQAFIQKKSCWLFHKKCPCSFYNFESCNTCPIYEEHRKELEISALKGVNNKAFFDHLKPVFNDFLPFNSMLRSIDLRRKKILNQIALKYLKVWNNGEKAHFEHHLTKIYDEIFK